MTDKLSADMYKEHILENYKNPMNFGELQNPTHKHLEFNNLCGDKLELQLLVQDEIVKDIKFSGSGCAISIASASLLTEKIKNKEVSQVLKMNKEDILELLSVQINPARLKCALLALESVKGALRK